MTLSFVGVVTGVTSTRAGLVAPMVKELTARLSLVLLVMSVTEMVQLSYVPSARALNVIVLLEAVAAVVELLQLPPYVIVPASSELNV